jgi:hypothetical protein
MRYWTWAEIKQKLENDCDLQDETFIHTDELLGYANEAIDEAEAEIHSLYEDYFLSKVDIPVAAMDTTIDMPADIYANKIRRIIFTSSGGGSTYAVERMKDWHKFEEQALADISQSTDLYRYFITNEVPGEPKILFVPRLNEAGTMRIWFLRNANRLAVDTDICDIPEFINFVFAHMKVKVYDKEGHPGLTVALQKLEQERDRMNAVLSQMVPDADNEVELDLRTYGEMN